LTNIFIFVILKANNNLGGLMLKKLLIFAVMVFFIFSSTGQKSAVAESQKKLLKKYKALLEEADSLWVEYKNADKKYHEKGKVGLDKHIVKLADIQDRLNAVHTKWMNMETPDAVGTDDFKVGLALELQMAAIGAELVGLLDDDQDYMNISIDLDKKYEQVVKDLE